MRNQQTSFGGPLGKDHFLAIRVELERLRSSLIGIVVGCNCFDTLAYTRHAHNIALTFYDRQYENST